MGNGFYLIYNIWLVFEGNGVIWVERDDIVDFGDFFNVIDFVK